MSQTLAKVLVHIVYSTKGSRPWLTDPELRKDLYAVKPKVFTSYIDQRQTRTTATNPKPRMGWSDVSPGHRAVALRRRSADERLAPAFRFIFFAFHIFLKKSRATRRVRILDDLVPRLRARTTHLFDEDGLGGPDRTG